MLNTNQHQRDKSAQKDYRRKLALELALVKVLQPLFLAYSKEFEEKYSTTLLLPNNQVFEQDLKKVLQKHYDKVATKVATNIVNEVGKPLNHDLVLNSIYNRADLHHAIRADNSANVIAITTQKDLNKSIIETHFEAAKDSEILTREKLAKKARLKFDQKARGRLVTISTTETQNPAEHAKQAEIDFLGSHNSQIRNVNVREAKKTKQWVAILDKATREAHALADGQIVDIDEPYTVDGQKLMYPGDMDLGATIDNTINCRCASVIIIK